MWFSSKERYTLKLQGIKNTYHSSSATDDLFKLLTVEKNEVQYFNQVQETK